MTRVIWSASWAAVYLVACAASLVPGAAIAASTLRECAGADGHSSDAMAALRRNVEAGPMYAIPAAASGVAECRVGDDAGLMVLDYRFRDGGWLRVKRDTRIEYTEQKARFALSPTEKPTAVLMRAEHAAFGEDGCGIDWRTPKTEPAEDEPNASETVFRGDVCNCQARFRRDIAQRVVSFTLRGAC